jgi:hypothetical protein
MKRSLCLISLAVAGSCSRVIEPPVSCTEVFVTATVTVLDQTNAAVNGATVVVTVPRTGETLTPQSLALWAQGVYPIVDDAARTKLRETGDSVHVSVVSPNGDAVGKYFFDVPSGCHINKVSGPDTLKVQ